MPEDKTPRMSASQYLALEEASTSEREHQEAVFEYAEAKSAEVEELGLLYHIPNSHHPGARPEPGLRAGVPDLCLPVPDGDHGPGRWETDYHALYIELKKPSGTLREEQQKWIEALRKQGYKAAVCYGADEAIETLTDYLGIE